MGFGKLLGFVDKGTDEAILKSLPVEDASEDLVKAMNKQGLVQKEVQVKGKNGQVFTRKQWVKAGEDQQPQKGTSSSDNSSGSKTMEDLKNMSKKDLNKFLEDSPAGTEIKGLCSKRTGNELIVKKHEGYKAIYGGVGAGTRLKESYWEISGSPDHYILSTLQAALNGTSKYYKMSDSGNTTNQPDNSQKTQDNLNTDSNRAKAEHYLNHHLGSGETGAKVTSLETTKDGKVKVNYDVDVKISVGVDSETGQTEYEYDTEARSETYDLSDLGISSDTSKPTNNQDTKSEVSKEIKEVFVQKLHMPIPRSVKQAKSMLEDYKSRGYTSKKSRDAVIEASKLLGVDSNSSTTHQSTGGQKLSPADAKKKTQEITKGVSDKKSFMERAKAQGITWKENDHEGINWMRCCMAMNKHFAEGGDFSTTMVPDPKKIYDVTINGVVYRIRDVQQNTSKNGYTFIRASAGKNGMVHTLTEKEWATAKEVK